MGLLDSIRDRVSSTVTQAKQSVTEAAQKVESKVEEKVSAAGHAVSSAFESNPAPPPPPSAPPLPASARAVSSGPAGLRNALNASIADSVQRPSVPNETQAAARALKEKWTSWKGLDEKALATELAELVKKDPVTAAPLVRELMTQLDRGDKDDVGEVFADQLSPAQLQALSQHPDGAAAMKDMQTELLTGVSFGHEKEMAAKLGTALTDTSLPHVKIEQHPGELGINEDETKKTPSGPISAAEWADPSALVSKLSQNPSTATPSGNTCAASSMLSAALMASPEKAARFLENVALNDDTKMLKPSERTELVAIADRVRNKKATWEDLNKAQDLLFVAGNTHGDMTTLKKAIDRVPLQPNGQLANLGKNEDTEFRKLMTAEKPWTDTEAMRVQELFNRITGMSMHMEKGEGGWAPKIEGGLINLDKAGFTDDEAKRLAKLGKLGGDAPLPPGAPLAELAARLKPGEVISVRVSGSPDGKSSDHFISIGRRDDGNLFLTNSDPAEGDASLVLGGPKEGSESFRQLLSEYQKRQHKDPNDKLPAPVPFKIS